MNKKIIVLTIGLILGGAMPLKAEHKEVHGRSSAMIVDNREEGSSLRIAIQGEPAEVLHDLATKRGEKSYQGTLVVWSYEGWSCIRAHEDNSYACINDVTVSEPWNE